MSGSHVSDNDPAVIQAELARSKEGHVPSRVPTAPHWSERLASDSEAVVKAERHGAAGGGGPGAHPADPGVDVAGDVAELQAHTVAVLREEAWVEGVVKVPALEDEPPLTRGSKPT